MSGGQILHTTGILNIRSKRVDMHWANCGQLNGDELKDDVVDTAALRQCGNGAERSNQYTGV